MPARKLTVPISCTLASVVLVFGAAFPGPVFLLAQSSSSAPVSSRPNPALAQEFPVTMRESMMAGKTPVGKKVEAKLTLATLVNRVVIPEGATFSGEVIESNAMSTSDPSRFAVRMDLVKWKNGSMPIKVYLTAWYYPPPILGVGQVSISHPVGGFDTPKRPADEPAAETAPNRLTMKDVEVARAADGAIALTSTHFDIKLDKMTTYVLAE